MMESVRAESRDRARSTQIGIACELRPKPGGAVPELTMDGGPASGLGSATRAFPACTIRHSATRCPPPAPGRSFRGRGAAQRAGRGGCPGSADHGGRLRAARRRHDRVRRRARPGHRAPAGRLVAGPGGGRGERCRRVVPGAITCCWTARGSPVNRGVTRCAMWSAGSRTGRCSRRRWCWRGAGVMTRAGRLWVARFRLSRWSAPGRWRSSRPGLPGRATA
jgi:hypothetical protein